MAKNPFGNTTTSKKKSTENDEIFSRMSKLASQRVYGSGGKASLTPSYQSRVETPTVEPTEEDEKDFWDRVGYGAKSIGTSFRATIPMLGEAAKETASGLGDYLKEKWSAETWDRIGEDLRQTENRTEVENVEIGDHLGQIDPNSKGMEMMRESMRLREEATEGLSGGGKFLADTVMSIGQNAAMLAPAAIAAVVPGLQGAAPVLASAALPAMGAVSGAQKAYEVAESGGSAGEALGRGLVSGGIEAVTEKIPLDTLLDIVKVGGKGALKNILKQAGVEATEEGLSYTANYIADKAAGDPNARFSIAELLESAAAGGVSGLFFGGVGTGANQLYYSKVGKNYRGVEQDLVDEGMTFDTNSDAYQTAQELKGKLDAGKKLSNAQIGKAVVDNASAIRQEEASVASERSVKPVESSVETTPVQTRASVIQSKLAKAGVETATAESTAKTIDRILSGDTSISSKEKDVLSVGNAAARQVFEEETGVKLPASNSATRKAVSEYIAQTAIKRQETAKPVENVMTAWQNKKAQEEKVSQLKDTPVGYDTTSASINTTLQNAAEATVARAKVKDAVTAHTTMKTVGNKGQAVYQQYLPNAKNVSAYTRAFERYYDAGQIGYPLNRMISEYGEGEDPGMLVEAYNAGVDDSNIAPKGTSTSEKKNAQKGKKTASKGKGKFYDNRKDKSSGSVDEKTKSALKQMSKVFNVDIEIVDTISDSKGKSIANGYYANGKIVLAADSDNPLMTVVKHEITHHLQKTSPKQYKAFKDYVMQAFYNNSEDAMNLEIQRRIDLARRNNVKLTREGAMDEIVADATEKFLTDRDSIDALVRENRSLAETILNAIRDVLRKIEAAMKGVDLKGYSNFMNADQLKQAEKMWVEALTAAAEGREIGVNYAEISESSEPIWSLKSMKSDLLEGKMQSDLVEHGIMTFEESQNLMDQISKLIDEMSPFAHIVDMNEEYSRDNRPFSVYKDNSDPLYQVSLDFSTLCKKRLMTQFVMESLQTKLGKALSAQEQLAIRSKLEEYAETNKQIQVACALCYVEAARLKAPAQINRFLDDRDTYLTVYFAKKSKDLNKAVKENGDRMMVEMGYEAGTKLNKLKSSDKSKIDKANRKLRENYKPTAEEQKIIDRANKIDNAEFLSADGLTRLSLNEPVIYDAFTSTVRSATRSKALEGGVPYYYGDSKSVSDVLIEAMNAENGLRHQSWSDFEIVHLLDNIAAVIELSVRKAKMHAYTKVPEFVHVNGNTGIMINLSLIPAGKTGIENGKLVFSPTEGMDYQVAVDLRDQYHKTAGTIAIGIDDTQIEMLLNDPAIDYVIPYHASGMNAQLRKMAGIAGWSNYQVYQSEKPINGATKGNCPDELWHKHPDFSEWFDTSKLDMSKSGVEIMREAAGRYLVMCEERGLRPKFSDTKKHTDFSKHENYWKLLIDRKMVGKDGNIIYQQAVRPEFRFDKISEIVQAEIKNYDPTLLDSINDLITKEWESGGIKQREMELLADEKAKKKAAKVANGLLEQVVAPEGAQFMLKDSESGDYTTRKIDWAIDNEVISAKNKADLIRAIDNEIYRGYAIPKDKNGNYIVESGNVMMFTDGNRHNPSLDMVIVLDDEYETPMATAKEVIYYEAQRGDVRAAEQIIEGIYGSGYASIYNAETYRTDEGYDRRRKRSVRQILEDEAGEGRSYSLKDSNANQMEADLDALRQERTDLEDQLDVAYLDDLPDTEIRKLNNRLTKVNAEIDKIVAEERKASVLTPMQTILDNLSNYRRSDLESLAEQISRGAWDDYEELSRSELEDALRETILDRELSPLEMQSKKFGLRVRPVAEVQYQLKTPDEMLDITKAIMAEEHKAKAVTDAEIMSQSLKDLKLTGVERDTIKNYQDAMKKLADYEQELAVYEATKGEHGKGRSIYTDASGKVKKSGLKYSEKEKAEIQRKVEWWKRRLRDIEQKEEFKKVLKREKAKMTERHAKEISDLRSKYNERMDALREKRDEKIEAEKQKMRDYKDRQRDTKEYKALKAKLESDVKWLSDRLVNPTEAKHIPEEFKKGVAAFLNSLDFETKYTDSLEMRNGRPSQKVINLRSLRETYENILKDQSSMMELDETQLEALKELERICEYKRVADLDYSELGLVRDAIQYIKMSVAVANNSFNENIKETISQMGDALIDEQRNKKVRKNHTGAVGEVEKLLHYGNVAPADKFHRYGGVMEKLYGEIRKGFDKHINNVQSAISYTQNLIKGKEDAIKEWSGKNAKTTKFQISDGTTIELTPAQVMSLYALMKREQAIGHVLGSGIVTSGVEVRDIKKLGKVNLPATKKLYSERASRCTIEDIQKIVATLTPDQKKIADGVVRLFTTKCADWGNETSMKLYGYKKFLEPNYFPIKSSDAYLNARFDDSGDVLIKNLGFTKNTVVNANNPIVIEDIFDVLADHVNKMSMYNALVVPLTDFSRVFNYKQKNSDGTVNDSVQKALEASGGEFGIDYVKRFIKDVNKQPSAIADESLFNKVIANYKKAKIGANLRVLAQQPTSITRAAALVDPKYLIKGLQQKANYEEMFNNSEIAYWKSLGFYQTDMGRNMKDILLDNEGLLDKYTMGAYGKADDWAWGHLWNAIKLEQADAHPDMDKTSSEFMELVANRFEEVVDRTQVVDSVFHRSQMMRSPTVASKVATAFMSEPVKNYNLLTTALYDSVNSKDYSGFKRAMATYVVSAIATSAFAGVVDALRDDEDEDEEGNKRSLPDKYLENTIENIGDNINPLGMIPVVKEVQQLWGGYSVNRMEMASLTSLVNAAKMWTQNKYSFAYKFKTTVESISDVTGIPLKNVLREMDTVVRTVGNAIGGVYYGEYLLEKAHYNISNPDNRSKFYKHYTDALMAGDEAAADMILEDMVVNGIPYENIISKGYQVQKEAAFSEARKLIAAGKTEEAKSLIRKLAKQYDKSYTTLWKAVKSGDPANEPEETYDFKDLQMAVKKGKDTELIEDYLTEYGGYSEESIEEAIKMLTEKYR